MSSSNIGTCLFIATGVPATNDKAGYEALTWVEIIDAESSGTFSVSDTLVEFTALKDGLTRAIKGARAGNEFAIPFFGDGVTDPGQAAMRAAADDRLSEYSFRIVAPGGVNAEAASGIFHSFTKNPREPGSYEGGTVMFRQNIASTEYTLP